MSYAHVADRYNDYGDYRSALQEARKEQWAEEVLCVDCGEEVYEDTECSCYDEDDPFSYQYDPFEEDEHE